MALDPQCSYPISEPRGRGKAPFPVLLRYSTAKGRHLVARRDIGVGELLLESEAYAVAPYQALLGSVCQQCFRENSPRVLQCSRCQLVYYCSERCYQADQAYHEAECEDLQKYKQLPTEGVESAMPRLIVRLSHKRRLDDAQSGEEAAYAAAALSPTWPEVRSLVSHEELQDPQVFLEVQNMAERISQDVLGDDATFDTSLITKLFFAGQCNAHSISGLGAAGKTLGLGFFPLASMVNHSCVPNAHHYFRTGEAGRLPRLVFRSITSIAAGEEITYSYVKVYQAGMRRREALASVYRFRCSCSRCELESRDAVAADASIAGTENENPENGAADTVGLASTNSSSTILEAEQEKSTTGKKTKKKKGRKGGKVKAPDGDDFEAALREAADYNSVCKQELQDNNREPYLALPERYLVLSAANPELEPSPNQAETRRVSEKLAEEMAMASQVLASHESEAIVLEQTAAQKNDEDRVNSTLLAVPDKVESMYRSYEGARDKILRAAFLLHPRHESMFQAYVAMLRPAEFLHSRVKSLMRDPPRFEEAEGTSDEESSMLERLRVFYQAEKLARMEAVLAHDRVRYAAYTVSCIEGSLQGHHPETAESHRRLSAAILGILELPNTEEEDPVQNAAKLEFKSQTQILRCEWIHSDDTTQLQRRAEESAEVYATMLRACFGDGDPRVEAAQTFVAEQQRRLQELGFTTSIEARRPTGASKKKKKGKKGRK